MLTGFRHIRSSIGPPKYASSGQIDKLPLLDTHGNVVKLGIIITQYLGLLVEK